MAKIKSQEEHIFIKRKYKSEKEAFEEWEEYDSNTKRILYSIGKYAYIVKYIRVKKEEEITVISIIDISIFSNSYSQYVQAQQSSYRVAKPIRIFNYLCAAGRNPFQRETQRLGEFKQNIKRNKT